MCFNWETIGISTGGYLEIGVGANSLVKRDVPPFCVVVGNPAKIIKMYNPQTRNWELVKTEEEQIRIITVREAFVLPTREEYKRILAKNATVTCAYPIAAGRGECI